MQWVKNIERILHHAFTTFADVFSLLHLDNFRGLTIITLDYIKTLMQSAAILSFAGFKRGFRWIFNTAA